MANGIPATADSVAGVCAETILQGSLVTLRPSTPDDLPALHAILATPEVRRWWSDTELDLTDPDAELYTVEHKGRLVGLVQWYAEEDPEFRHAGLDVFLDPAVHGRGLGVDSVRTMARHLVDAHGFHRLVIDPAVDNLAAIRCYEKVGFRPVGVMREYWCDPSGVWRDGLLMDLLARELT
jgi:aminoglycoside 6'-N-acetyltransferase